MAKVRHGYMKCETRGCVNGDGGAGRVLVKRDEKTGTMSYRCDECDKPQYAIGGTTAARLWEKQIELLPAAAPAPAPAKDVTKEPAAPPKPGAKPARRPTSLLDEAAGG